MRRLLISVLTVVSAITSAAKSDAFAKIDVYQLIERADQFTLYSVDPTPPESLPPEKKKTEIERFHGYVVLGRIDAESSKMKERIRKTLTATFTDMYDGPPMLPAPEIETYMDVLGGAVSSWHENPGDHTLEVQFPDEEPNQAPEPMPLKRHGSS